VGKLDFGIRVDRTRSLHNPSDWISLATNSWEFDFREKFCVCDQNLMRIKSSQIQADFKQPLDYSSKLTSHHPDVLNQWRYPCQ
jgi:hypothetical protein